MHRLLIGLLSLLSAVAVPTLAAAKQEVAVFFDARVAPAAFGAAEIRRAVEAGGDTYVEQRLDEASKTKADLRIVLAATSEESQRLAKALGMKPPKHNGPQCYAIRTKTDATGTTITILGADAAGAMYGALDVAEAIRLMGTVPVFAPAKTGLSPSSPLLPDSDRTPYIARRGIKFNIPLDARTPSYSDAGDAAQQNIAEMWSRDFWREFLDEMARQRFNVLTLWNLHPFPSLVRVPEFPDVALSDVMRTTAKFDSTYSLSAHDMVRKETLANLETLKRMTIEEKIAFWRDVMQMARDRGIEVYLFTWNIFVWGAEGKHGITAAQNNPATVDYFRASVRETVLTYPLLAGIGITSGERMQNRKDEFSKEKWLWKTYGEGVRDALQKQPGRKIRLIHRFHQTNLREIAAEWKEYPGTFDLSFKYAIAHMYASPAPPFAKQALAELPKNLRMWMTVRNDDIYSFRWGDPEFARAFVRNLPGPDKLAGYYMGPDGYIWGREFLSTEPETPRQLVLQKQWYSFMLWGRLSYDPTLPDALFERTLAARFPEVPAQKLFAASSRASKIIPLVTRSHWGDIDLKWFPEACISHPTSKGFHTVQYFIDGESMPGSGILSIKTYRDRLLAGEQGEKMQGITPPQVAAELEGHAAATLQLLAELGPAKSKELRLTLGDFEAMAHLGNYYAEKTRGATELALFQKTGKPEQQTAAVKHLESALGHWKRYAEVATRQYRPQLLTRIGPVDLNALTVAVQRDIEIARRGK